LGGGLVKAACFQRYLPDELPAAFERVLQSWDTANKATELSDFSVCTSWGVAGKNLYLIDVLRRRMEYPDLKRAVREQYERFNPAVVLIEDKASGTQLVQELLARSEYLSGCQSPARPERLAEISQWAVPPASPGNPGVHIH
jgi:phage terminase large subunit-like protein